MIFKVESVKSEKDCHRDELWRFYEKAIEGRNTHYAQYMKFLNQYAIFTGALFVAFYTLLKSPENFVYAVLVALLGLVTSILWLFSVKGYYAWIISWINVVQYYEDRLNKGRKASDACYVYRLFHEHESKACILTKPNRYSTQKLTMLFIEFVILSWFIAITILIYCRWCACSCVSFLSSHMSFILALVMIGSILVLVCVWGSNINFLKDNVDSHYQLITLSDTNEEYVKQRFVVKPPSSNVD